MNFLKKHKKLSITMMSILAILIVLIILMFTLFSLKSVEINHLTTTNKITSDIEQSIISEINLGGTVLFKDKEKIINDIELKYPYVNLVNIETVFPNKFVLNIAEREPIYCITYGEESVVLDSDLKVLQKDLVKVALDLNIFDLDIDISKINVGQKLDLKSLNSIIDKSLGEESDYILKNFADICSKVNKNVSDITNIFDSLNLKLYKDYRDGETKINLQLFDKNGFEIDIYNPIEHFENKIYKMFYVYSDICTNSPEKLTSTRLIVYTNLKNQDSVLNEEI